MLLGLVRCWLMPAQWPISCSSTASRSIVSAPVPKTSSEVPCFTYLNCLAFNSISRFPTSHPTTSSALSGGLHRVAPLSRRILREVEDDADVMPQPNASRNPSKSKGNLSDGTLQSREINGSVSSTFTYWGSDPKVMSLFSNKGAE